LKSSAGTQLLSNASGNLIEVQAKEIISDIADQLGEQNQMPSLQEKKEKILASLACSAAIKANTVLSSDEVAALCRDLEETLLISPVLMDVQSLSIFP